MSDLNEKIEVIWNTLSLCCTFIMYAANFPTKMLTLKKCVKGVYFFPCNLIPLPFFLSGIPGKFWRIADNVLCNLYYSCILRVIFPFCGDFSSLQWNIDFSKTVLDFLKLAEGRNAWD